MGVDETLPGGNMPGSIISVSARGTDPQGGIVWASHALLDDATNTEVTGVLRAFAALEQGSVLKELWSSEQEPHEAWKFAKFCPPTVANGKVYLATFSNRLDVYGLLC